MWVRFHSFLLHAFNHQSCHKIQTFHFGLSLSVYTEIIKTVSGALSDVANASSILCTFHLGHTECWLQCREPERIYAFSRLDELTGNKVSLRIRQRKDCEIYHERHFAQIVETQFKLLLLFNFYSPPKFSLTLTLISSTSNIIHHLVSWRLRIESM